MPHDDRDGPAAAVVAAAGSTAGPASCLGLTPRAARLLDRVRAALEPATPLAFLISDGCCGGTSPVLCLRDAVLTGVDVELGNAGGVTVFAPTAHARYLARDRFLIDALDDPRSDTFSLETAHGGRFILRELAAPMSDQP